MTHVLLLEPFGGLAGDMLLAALLDLERPALRLEELAELARALVGEEARLGLEETRRGGLRAKRLIVETPESARPPHRGLAELTHLVEKAALSETVRTRTLRCLRRLAEAEAAVHGTSIERVHFHEIGAVDTLIDVCGAFFALERLEVARVQASTPYLGGGTVRTEHGEMPVPAPATAELLRERVVQGGPGGERVTPTGAALLCELTGAQEPFGEWRPLAIGYGAGTRDPESGPPNLLRVILASEEAAAPRASVTQMELHLDDATGEEVAFLLEELRAGGALDAWTQPIQMKKGRPGTLVSLLCREEQREELERVAFRHSPTLGVRWSQRWRSERPREELRVAVHGEEVRVKLRRAVEGGVDGMSVEYEDLARLARRLGRPLRELERVVLDEADARLQD
jgi:uncharacterized protein (TIGR00299 family) protein